MTTIVIILLAVYVVSAIMAGFIQWAIYRDTVGYLGRSYSLEEKVVKLYICPLIPILNTAIVLNGLLTTSY